MKINCLEMCNEMLQKDVSHRIKLESDWVGSRDENPFKGLLVKTRALEHKNNEKRNVNIF